MEDEQAEHQGKRFFQHVQEILEAEADAPGKGHEGKQPRRPRGICGQMAPAKDADQDAGRRDQRHQFVQLSVQRLQHGHDILW